MAPAALPPPSITAAPAPVAAPAADEPIVQWKADHAHKGLEFEMQRSADGLVLRRRDAELEIRPLPDLGDCIDDPPSRAPDAALPLEHVDDSPQWWALRGGDEGALVRLSADGAKLIVNDGCLRMTDVTLALFGVPSSDDPFFSADQLAPDDAVEIPPPILSDGAVTLPGGALIEIAMPPGDAAWTHLRHGDRSWLRLQASDEIALRGKDAIAAREHALVWSYDVNGRGEPPQLLMDNLYRYGESGTDRESTRTQVERSVQHARGELRVSGTRSTVADAMNVGAGKCPEMEGAIAFRDLEESLRFEFVSSAGARVALGESSRRVLAASGCLDIARAEVRKRTKTLADKAPSTTIQARIVTSPTSSSATK